MHTHILILLLMGVAGAIAGGCVMGYRAKKKFLANKKLSKKQKKERGLSK